MTRLITSPIPVIAWSDITWYCIHQYSDCGRIQIRVWTWKDTPYLTLTGKLWCAFCKDFEENRPHYNNTTLYIETFCSNNNFPSMTFGWFTAQLWSKSEVLASIFMRDKITIKYPLLLAVSGNKINFYVCIFREIVLYDDLCLTRRNQGIIVTTSWSILQLPTVSCTKLQHIHKI